MASGPSRYAFPKSHRLLKRDAFLRVQSSSHRVASRHLVILYLKNNLGHVRVGITVSKRHGKAVRRNRLKRVIRAAVRLSMPQLRTLSLDLVVLPRRSDEVVGSRGLREEIGTLIPRFLI